MRGKEAAHDLDKARRGITPAYAGKRAAASPEAAGHQDHPRVCGEKPALILRITWLQGSPPRMRGKAAKRHPRNPRAGITPAYAGKSTTPRSQAPTLRDHPRVCGEKALCAAGCVPPRGSPPRMRGKGLFSSMWRRYMGITPAYAGKRLKRSHRIGHFSCILCLFHSVLHRASASGGSRAGPCAPPCLPAQNAVPV